MANNNQIGKTKYTSQNIHNLSFDDDYKVQVVELLEYNPEGEMIRKVNDPTEGYRICDIDSAGPSYYGFSRQDGSWYILRGDSGAYRYFKGGSSYSTNWTNRASLSYDYFDVIF